MARAPCRTLGGLSLRGADPITEAHHAGPRLGPLFLTLAGLILAVAYAVPLLSTGDPLWFLPTRTAAERIEVHWEGRKISLEPTDARYRSLMDALNDAFDSPTGIELNYGLRPSDVAALRTSGRALEALYRSETRAHGRYALAAFTHVLVPFDGEEYARRLVFVGDESGYRAGPLRSPAAVERLRALAEAAR